MNILQELNFSDLKPAILAIKKTDKINIICVGLKTDQWLKKHATKFPTMLTVLKGNIEFEIEGQVIALSELDTFDIPVNVEHAVKGVAIQNIFSLTQEK